MTAILKRLSLIVTVPVYTVGWLIVTLLTVVGGFIEWIVTGKSCWLMLERKSPLMRYEMLAKKLLGGSILP